MKSCNSTWQYINLLLFYDLSSFVRLEIEPQTVLLQCITHLSTGPTRWNVWWIKMLLHKWIHYKPWCQGTIVALFLGVFVLKFHTGDVAISGPMSCSITFNNLSFAHRFLKAYNQRNYTYNYVWYIVWFNCSFVCHIPDIQLLDKARRIKREKKECGSI